MMTHECGLKKIGISVATMVALAALMPVTASAKARVVPKEVQGTWIHWNGDPNSGWFPREPIYSQLHLMKQTMWFSDGGVYLNGKWTRCGAHTLKLSNKVKKNKTFTLSKRDKAGYRTVKFNDTASTINQLKVKRVRVNKKSRLRMKFYENGQVDSKKTANAFRPSKTWLLNNGLVND